MHTLEYMILQLAVRIEKETGNKQLAEDTKALATVTHGAFSETDNESLRSLYSQWTKKYDHVMRSK